MQNARARSESRPMTRTDHLCGVECASVEEGGLAGTAAPRTPGRYAIDDQQRAPPNAELLVDVLKVLLDRVFRDAELVSDLLVGHALREQADDLQLAVGAYIRLAGEQGTRLRCLEAPVGRASDELATFDVRPSQDLGLIAPGGCVRRGSWRRVGVLVGVLQALSSPH